ncbi:DEAD/DEAH box helicase family protein [Stenotrophomonas sp. GD03777]|uniref:DEAD/DEAH box helicase n=1 Tax=Stenotrophomonas sp. GD03777 TaxID=2975380 RepID=UPI00244A042A|nr:DEAD/DEAH box helicase family protein [Stenotrophomonas sp. GD03777]MDH1659877.1 DEAD/DEAH box helicase family protein [Stenotrophomonas sp. GD03777]
MIHLPPLIVERRHAAGTVRHQLRPAADVVVRAVTSVKISPRVEQPLWELDTGERIVVTSRSGVVIPDGADGVLRERDGAFSWVSHRLIEQFVQEATRVGWHEQSRRIAAKWNGRLAFRAEVRQRDDGEDPGEAGLRPPQLGALHAIGAHWSLDLRPATVVMPTGTGKTETMLATLAAYARNPILVVVPWDLLRKQTANKFLAFGLLRALGVLPHDVPNPIVGIMTKRPTSVADLELFNECNVIVATIHTVGVGVDTQLLATIAQRCKALILDEAHHVAATNWNRLKTAFQSVPILQFTATPFRRDGQLVDGRVIFNYSLASAQRDGYFKRIRFEPIHEVGGTTRSDHALAAAAVHQLRQDLGEGLDHLMMARCASIGRAATVYQIYHNLAPDLRPVLIHSDEPEAAVRLAALRAGQARIVVCVDMLGEGFDLPQLKVAAIHDMHRSLAILLQFVGRFTRVAGARIGEATALANLADPGAAHALERLYSEDADWNQILSELSSQAARDHAELVEFLQTSQRLDDTDEFNVAISQQLLRPVFSTAVYRVPRFLPERFHSGLAEARHVHAVWLHHASQTLYFVTRTEPRVRWTQSKGVRDREWALFVLHYDPSMGLLFLSSTDHSSLFGELAEAVSGESELISGENMFRVLGHINRLVFQSMGVKKHGRRNLSFAMYTGGDVAQALGMTERQGSVKNNVSGIGWEAGAKVSVGCSYKGRVWSREQGTVPALVNWCKAMGTKLLDDSIDVATIIANVLIPEEVTGLPPDKVILSLEWPAELLAMAEERVVLATNAEPADSWPLYLVDIDYDGTQGNDVYFSIRTDDQEPLAKLVLSVGGRTGYSVAQTDGDQILISVGRRTLALDAYLCECPPLLRFVDLCELDGNLLIRPQDPRHLVIDDSRFESWDWTGVDITKESMWKNGALRQDSIQWKAARHFIDGGFEVVFDDDAAGEAADLVCLKEEDDSIRLALIHCKFSGNAAAGERIKDVVEVCSQAIRSAKWKWRFADLGKHLLHREDRLRLENRLTRFLEGGAVDLNRIVRASRFKPVEVEVLVVQPGISAAARSDDQNMVLASAAAYLKETIGCDLDIVCSM